MDRQPVTAAAAAATIAPSYRTGLDMARATRRKVKRFLRLPKVIVAELTAIAVTGALGAIFPQAGSASVEELSRLRAHGAAVTAIVDFLALDHLFKSAWFLALLLLATASLSIVVVEQIRRLEVMWRQKPTAARLRRAKLRAEFDRPAETPPTPTEGKKIVELRTVGKLGLAGSPLFHLGLLLVIVAAALRALFAVDAVVDVIEGETLPATASAWARHWPGVMGQPFSAGVPLTVDSVMATRYESGDLQALRVGISIEDAGGARQEQIAVNTGLSTGTGRVFLTSEYGPAALLEWQHPDGTSERVAVLMVRRDDADYGGSSVRPEGISAHLRTRVDSAGTHPASIDLRIMQGDGLLLAAPLYVGESVILAGGDRLTLHGLPFWVRLRGSRDAALWLAYLGFTAIIVGATVMFCMIKVDTCVVVTSLGETERVFVALQAQRFEPLFQERFERLVRRNGGPA